MFQKIRKIQFSEQKNKMPLKQKDDSEICFMAPEIDMHSK